MIKIKRPLFSLHCDESLTEQGEWAADIVTNFKNQPPGIEDGVTIQLGWTLLKFIKIDGELILCEPDYYGNPFKDFKPDISTSLWALASQIDFVTGLDCQPYGFRFDEKVILKKGCLSEDKLYAHRQNPSENDSGWYIGPASNMKNSLPPDASELEAIYAFELLKTKPYILDALVLPINWIVVWDDNQVTHIFNENNECVGP